MTSPEPFIPDGVPSNVWRAAVNAASDAEVALMKQFPVESPPGAIWVGQSHTFMGAMPHDVATAGLSAGLAVLAAAGYVIKAPA